MQIYHCYVPGDRRNDFVLLGIMLCLVVRTLEICRKKLLPNIRAGKE